MLPGYTAARASVYARRGAAIPVGYAAPCRSAAAYPAGIAAAEQRISAQPK